MFEPIRTSRLILRAPVPADVDALHARRNDPAVARFQDWELPLPRRRSRVLIEGAAALDGPIDDEWWMVTVCRADTAEVIGDLAVRLSWHGRTAEIGFTFARTQWGPATHERRPTHWSTGCSPPASTACRR